MTLHWLDGFRSLRWDFWKTVPTHPLVCLSMLMLVVLVAGRDFILWVLMGDRYLDEE